MGEPSEAILSPDLQETSVGAELDAHPAHIADVLADWRRAERESLAADAQSVEAMRIADEIGALRSMYQSLVRRASEALR